jgi:phosphopantetheine--protein transferase-like protein
MGNTIRQDIANDGETHTVLLTLFRISKEVKDDPEAITVTRIVTESLADACTAQAFWTNTQASIAEKEQIQKHVLRFLQVKDKYGSLGSFLLKSHAFHVTHNSRSMIASSATCASGNEARLPIVALPRTKHNKPYIPIRMGREKLGSIQEENIYPISISHQFPFVGAATVECEGNYSEFATSSSSSPPSESRKKWRPIIGMDIVTFDKVNPRLYAKEQEFINVFQSNFTQWEWTRIHSRNASHFHELYVRWSMKEAYTKALGVGMGVSFDSFDMRTSMDDDDIHDERGLWSVIQKRPNGISVLGSIVHHRRKGSLLQTTISETWQFFFLPLPPEEGSLDLAPLGCACICMERSNKSSAILQCQIKVEWTELQSLLQWHHQC